ncbi:MAG: hypothetical protein AAF679_12225 [Pseudomonadota bacterium]
MILPVAFALGFGFGWWRAGKRGGNRADKLQYGFGHGVAGLLVALTLVILFDRIGVI